MRRCFLMHTMNGIFIAVLLLISAFGVTQTAYAAERYYTSDRVNLRSGPSTGHDRLKILNVGTEVQVITYNADEWSTVIYKEITGYIKSEFLSLNPPENEPKVLSEKVQLMNWADAKNVVRIGAPISVYDVYSGLTYNIKSFSNGAHADVEPITTEDTAIMKRTYGGKWSWSPRPVWVTVGDTTIAAAINGMPHGGGINSNNGMQGQVCLHFLGSSVHNGNRKYNGEMQSAVQTAFHLAQ